MMDEGSARRQMLVEEWKEARGTIARFDENLQAMRTYGFTLATIMVGAEVYVSTEVYKKNVWAGAATSIVVMMLIMALFLLDMRARVLQNAAIRRGEHIEAELREQAGSSAGGGPKLCEGRRCATKGQLMLKRCAPLTYCFFLLAAAVIGIVFVLTADSSAEASLALHQWLPPLALVVLVYLVLTAMIGTWGTYWGQAGKDLLVHAGYYPRRTFESRWPVRMIQQRYQAGEGQEDESEGW